MKERPLPVHPEITPGSPRDLRKDPLSVTEIESYIFHTCSKSYFGIYVRDLAQACGVDRDNSRFKKALENLFSQEVVQRNDMDRIEVRQPKRK